MNDKQRSLQLISTALNVTAILSFPAAGLWYLRDRFAESVEAGGERLVYHTDNAAVLQACHVVLADPQAAGFPALNHGGAQVSGSQSGDDAPAALPTALKNLNFEVMTVQDNQATIYFGGGFGHWGYTTTPDAGAQLQLVPGLWFFSDYGVPPDLTQHPYYRPTHRLLAIGLISTVAAIALTRYRKRRLNRDDTPTSG